MGKDDLANEALHEHTACKHDHDHGDHDHNHYHGPMHVHGATSGPMLWASLAVTTIFVIAEAFFGYKANSLALLSDAGHNFSDALALGLAAYAVWIARRPANARKTFGYHRVAILTALFNAGSLIAIAVGIVIEAISRFRNPEPLDGNIMLAVSAVALLMNTVIAALLHQHSHSDLNVRAAFIHMAGDALSALAVIIAALVFNATGWMIVDPIVSTMIAIFILWSSWGIFKEATNILLEATPKGLEVDELVAALRNVEHVVNVHDLHVWTVSDGLNFLSCHVEVANTRTMEEIERILCEINTLLESRFGITHATIQTEREGSCVVTVGHDALYCGEHRGAA
ncbi:MAG TPA: cation diffusion facilitator family transporter [Capsulimonadaceae bacterium]|jgi:cobalt-zinc-cadmium efflux system protein